MELKGSKTEKNLMEAFAGESQARNKYTYYASQAKKEGYVQISKIFEATAENEKHHEDRYKKLLENVKNGKVFEKEETVEWECANCGFRHSGSKSVEMCPVCKHPKAFFFVSEANY